MHQYNSLDGYSKAQSALTTVQYKKETLICTLHLGTTQATLLEKRSSRTK